MKAAIQAVSYHLPEAVLGNDELGRMFPEWTAEKISQKLGIEERRIAGADECSSDLAVGAAQKLFQEHGIKPGSIDFLLFCTQSPDYFLPTTACLIQDRLGIPTTSGALDFNLGCSGYIYGLSLAKGLVETGQANNVLLLTAETYSKFMHPKDKSVRTLFGDAAAATLVTAGIDGKGIGRFAFGTDGRGSENLIVKTGGIRFKRTDQTALEYTDENGNTRNQDSIYMNGAEIVNFTLSAVPDVVNRLLEKEAMAKESVDLFILHQANKYLLDALTKKLGLPPEKVYRCMRTTGNTVSSTIPIAYSNAMREMAINKNQKIMLVGFGVGYSWAGCMIHT